MRRKSIFEIEHMLSIFIDSIDAIISLNLLSDLLPSFETFYTKRRRNKYFRELLFYIIKSEIILELAYEYAMNEAHIDDLLFHSLQEKYRRYLIKAVYSMYLYDRILKESLTNNQMIENTSTIFRS